MAVQRTFALSQGWVQVTSMLVTELNIPASSVNPTKFMEFTVANEFLDVRTIGTGFLAWRIHSDSHDGPLVRSGYLPWQRVVHIEAETT